MPILLAALAVQQQSQTIRFKSGAEMLDTFGMQKRGKEYRRLVAAFERIFGATIFFSTDNRLGRAPVVHMARFAFLREAQIWYDLDARSKVPWQYFENVIVLSEEFYKEVIAHPIPTASKLLRFSRERQPSWICSCGCVTGASFRVERNQFRCLDNTV